MIRIAKKSGMKYDISNLSKLNIGQTMEDSRGQVLTWRIVDDLPVVEKQEFVAMTVEEEEEKTLKEAFAVKKSQLHEEIRREIFGKVPKAYRKPLPANAKNYEKVPFSLPIF